MYSEKLHAKLYVANKLHPLPDYNVDIEENDIYQVSRIKFNEMHTIVVKELIPSLHRDQTDMVSNLKYIEAQIILYNDMAKYGNDFRGKWVKSSLNDYIIKSDLRRATHLQNIKIFKNDNAVLEKDITNKKMLIDSILAEMQLHVDRNVLDLAQGKLHINSEGNSLELETDGIRKTLKVETKQNLYENIALDLNNEILNYRAKYSDLIKEKYKSTRLTKTVLQINKGRKTTDISKDIEELLEVIKKTNTYIRLNRLTLNEINTQ